MIAWQEEWYSVTQMELRQGRAETGPVPCPLAGRWKIEVFLF